MKLYGREYKFKLTVGAAIEIAELCPDGDLGKIGEVLRENFPGRTKALISMVAALSRGYEEAAVFEDPGYLPDPLTEKEIAALELENFNELTKEAMAAFRRDQETSVEAAPAKKNEKADGSN